MALCRADLPNRHKLQGRIELPPPMPRKTLADWWTNKRMPDAATFESVDNVQQAILYRKGRSMMGGAGAMRTAVCPHWNEISALTTFIPGAPVRHSPFHHARFTRRRDSCATGRIRAN